MSSLRVSRWDTGRGGNLGVVFLRGSCLGSAPQPQGFPPLKQVPSITSFSSLHFHPMLRHTHHSVDDGLLP